MSELIARLLDAIETTLENGVILPFEIEQAYYAIKENEEE